MKKEAKSKGVATSSKRRSYSQRGSTISNKKIHIKFKSIGLLITLVIYVILVIIAYNKIGKIGLIGVGGGLGVLLLFILILLKLKGKKRKKFITAIIILVLTLTIIMMGAFASFLFYIKSISDPLYAEKENNLNTKETTTIYDKNGVEFAKLGSEMREKVTYEELPEVLIDAIVATEDSRFFQHNGFDAARFIKAAIGQIAGNRSAGGASTLSMQVVKNVFTDAKADSGKEGVIRKFQDIYLAVFKLEKNYTKEEIIEFYVNNHYLGGNVYGVEEASQTYFGKSAGELTLSEAAVIAGMFKSPTYYKPDTKPENAEARRTTVLYLMKRHGYITEEEETLANSIPVNTLVNAKEAQANPYQGFIDTVVKEIKDKYKVNAYTTSLKVYTTLDRGRQDAVDRVLSGEAYSWINDKVQTGVAVIESDTGAILAVGTGRNRSGINSYNYATQIKRQPGSTAKPLFDYGPGIEYNDWSTYTLFDDAPYSYSNGRSIKNWDGGYYGTITLRRALSTSRNIPALKAFQQVDNKKIAEFVTNLGIIPEICESGYTYDKENNICINRENQSDKRSTINLHEAHSIGAFTGVSPLQMAAAYAAFSNGGYYNEPYSVSRIEFRSTGEIQEHQPNKNRVMADSTAFMISSVLQNVALTDGTPNNVACKTGTTNYDDSLMNSLHMPGDAIRDSWVVGYSTKTTIGMWYGYDNMNQDMVNQGYVLHNIPATIQKDRLFRALVNSGAMEANRESFIQPSSVVKVGVAQNSNPPKLAGNGTAVVYEYFKKGTEPTETATGDASIKAPSGLKATIDRLTHKITLSWNPVDPGINAKSEYGTFGYNIYLNNRLITWTDKTTYTSYEFGTYKIVATYKGYSGIKSDSAEIIVKKQEEETKPQDDNNNNNGNNNGNNNSNDNGNNNDNNNSGNNNNNNSNTGDNNKDKEPNPNNEEEKPE